MVRAKGGNVQGKVGTAYGNRSDLNKQEPITTAPGQEYGKRSQQQAAQRSVPMAPPPQAGPAPAAGAPSAPTPSAEPPAPIINGLGKGNAGLGLWTHPTERPDEPITAGMASGPGPGPEVLGGVGAAAANGAVEQGTLKSLLGHLANGPTSSTALRDLAAVAGAT